MNELGSLLGITRPLIVFDTEATGTNARTDRICSLGFVQINPDETFREWESLINPTVPIPEVASGGDGQGYPGHGITDGMVKDSYTFAQMAQSLLKGFHDCDYAGYGVRNFDLPLMQAEFERAGHQWSYDDARILDSFRIWQLGERRSLSDAVEHFLLRRHRGAHGALADVKETIDVLIAQRAKFPQLPGTLEALHTLSWPVDPNALDPKNKLMWKDDEVIMNFGKRWKGMPLRQMARKDLLWITNEADGLSPQVRRICAEAAEGRFPCRS